MFLCFFSGILLKKTKNKLYYLYWDAPRKHNAVPEELLILFCRIIKICGKFPFPVKGSHQFFRESRLVNKYSLENQEFYNEDDEIPEINLETHFSARFSILLCNPLHGNESVRHTGRRSG